MCPLCQMAEAAQAPPGKSLRTPRFEQREGQGGKDSSCCISWANSRESTAWGLQSPLGDSTWPKPPGLMGTHPGSHLTPALMASWEKNERLLLSSLESPGEGAVTTDVMAAQALSLCGQEGDLGGGDGGQGEGGGSISPKHPVQQLLLLLLELSP